MKPLSTTEVQNLALELKTFEGSRLQEVRLHGDLLCFGLYRAQHIFWLVFDLNPRAPQVLLTDDLAFLPKREEKKPIILFMRAHIVGRKWSSIEAPPPLGRVLKLHLSAKAGEETEAESAGVESGAQTEIEIRLIPRAPNVIVTTFEKSIALHKPLELKPMAVQEEFVRQENSVLETRTLEWFAGRSTPAFAKPKTVASTNVAKIEKAIMSIEKDLLTKRSEKWSEVGEWVKLYQTLEVPSEYAAFINRKRNLAGNLDVCFSKAKEAQKKIGGAEARLRELRKQLQALQSGEALPHQKNQSEKSQLMKGAQAKGRTFRLVDGLTLFVGKSAEDNLRLLREAKPWYLWVHLRDEPSAHAVISRNKNQNVPATQLHEAAHHLLEKTFGERQKDHWGEKYTVLVAECRFVRPIKGDRLGRVHYSGENSFVHLFKNS